MSDTLATLQKALAPKTGMRRIPFPLESYQHPSVPLSAKHLVNLFAEGAPADARTQAALLSTPGLEVFTELGSGPIHAVNGELPGRIYVVSGTRFYRIRLEIGGMFTDDLGEIGTPDIPAIPQHLLMPTIAVGATACVVCVPPHAFTCDHDNPLNQLGGTFPDNATSVAFLDGYFGFTSSDSLQQFYICRLLDPANFDALDFASADAVPNTIHMIVGHAGNFWLMGAAGIEVWYDAGNPDFPFRRVPGGVIAQTSATPHAVSRGDNSVFWIGLDNIVFRSNLYKAERISTHAIERMISILGGSQLAVSALTYSQGGHSFYAVNFATRTLVYDCTTKLWHDRSSSQDASLRWRANAATPLGDLPLLGDWLSGKLFIARPELGTEDGLDVIRQMVLPPLWAGTYRAFCARLEVEMETGGEAPPGDVILQWTDDAGATFSAPRRLAAGFQPAARRRVFTTRLGSFRQRIFSINAGGHVTFYAVDADITGGTERTTGGIGG